MYRITEIQNRWNTILTNLQSKIDKFKIIDSDFNSPLSGSDIKNIQNISKGRDDVNTPIKPFEINNTQTFTEQL